MLDDSRFLVLEIGTDTLSRNVRKEIQLVAG